MPAVPLPIHLLKVVWKVRTGTNHQCRNIQYYEMPTGFPTQSNLDDYSHELSLKLRPILNSGSDYTGVDLYVGTGGDPGFATSTQDVGNGSRGAALCPPNVQHLIKKTGELAGRHNRGRAYIPDVSESAVDDTGSMNDTELGLVQDLADIMSVELPHSFSDATFPITYDVLTGTLGNQLTAFTAERMVATQRRRYKRG